MRVFGVGSRVRRASMTEPAVIAPVGELDLHTVRALTPQLDEAVAADYPQVILDLSAVTLVDSTALGAIMQAEHRFRGQGRTLSVVAPNGSAAAVLLELTGLRGRFSVFPSRDAASA
ncbi:MAG: anti-sigma factor antagonist [Solirubrobacteraceae bacterium]|nr:anti-sigma factor antagonist [Solirubrobacteraceae bacterium]